MKTFWGLGDYTRVPPYLEPNAIALADACAITPGTKILDVAAGTGNFAVAAARRGAKVSACDLAPAQVALGEARTAMEGVEVAWAEGDAEDLPYPNGTFDLAASVFGAMFAPRPDEVAAQLFRVVRPGGTVAMANYGQDGYLWEVSELAGRYALRPPLPFPSPFEWGQEDIARARLEPYASTITVLPSTVRFEFANLEQETAFWAATNPAHIALRSMLDPDTFSRLEADRRALVQRLNRGSANHVVLESSALLVIATKWREGQFRYAISASFTIDGRGTVVVAEEGGGPVRMGDVVDLIHVGHRVRLRCGGIEMGNRRGKEGGREDFMALHLDGVAKFEPAPGDYVEGVPH